MKTKLLFARGLRGPFKSEQEGEKDEKEGIAPEPDLCAADGK